MMMVSDEEKRWLVVGIATNKVAAPVLRDYIKQGMDTHYTNLDIYCSGLTTPCTLKTLTYHHVNTDPSFKHFKFQNVNNNLHLHGIKHRNLYNYSVNSSVDLAKLFLPDYLAQFSAFDESLDISAILRLLGFNKPAPIFLSPLISIQKSADDVRENVRNKWGHCNFTDWTALFYNDCFSKLETLVRSLGLTVGIEKTTLDQLSDWKTKGCQLCMGHAVDQNLLSLVQQDVKELITNLKKTEAEQKALQQSLGQLRTEQRESQSSTRVQLEEYDEQWKVVVEWKEKQLKESEEILEKLELVEKTLTEELLIRVQGVEQGLAETDVKVVQLEQEFAKTDNKLEQLGQEFAKTDNKVDQLEQGFFKTDTKLKQLEKGFAKVEKDVSEKDDKVRQLEQDVISLRVKENEPEASPVDKFDVKTCQRKLAEHYQKKAKVPTTVWSSVFQVELEQIYTRLSWVKEEHRLTGSSLRELSHYTDIFTEKTRNGDVPKRILVQGDTGIGKTTFVKRLLVDWSNLEEATMDEKQKDTLRKFEIVVSVNLKEVSKCQTLREVIKCSRLFPADEERSVDDLLCYIHKNQGKVLLVFDGYDEYRTGSEAEEKYGSRSNSPIYEIFQGNVLRDCNALVTTRSSRADEIRGPADIQAEIIGFNDSDRKEFMGKVLDSQTQVEDLLRFLSKSKMEDLARVPLLSLFFCLLWKEEKEDLMELTESKTKLYQEIMEHILQHSHRKHFSSKISKLKKEKYDEVLVEIGKVALEGLLKGDLVFKYGQLPEKVRSEESVVIGLLQLSEYGPRIKPMEMVSFIHKSIQEYLAAWYITRRCVPKGSLGGIEQHARTLEDCQAFENVFQFVCGLSKDGAVKVLEHLKSVRISDPTLDLSKIIPDVENETDVPLCDVTDRQRSFSDLVYDSFREVHSKAELLSHRLECTGGIILVTRDRPLPQIVPKGADLSTVAHLDTLIFGFSSIDWFMKDSILYKLLEFLDCLLIPLGVTRSSFLTFEEFVKTFPYLWSLPESSFISILCFRDGRFQFYLTDLMLRGDSSPSANACSEMSHLKFVTSLRCFYHLSGQKGKALGTAIENCKHLKRIVVSQTDDSICDLLEHVQNPSKCSLEIGFFHDDCCNLTSAGAVKLATLLPRFNNIITLHLGLSDCSSAIVETLVASITHKTLESLHLRGVRLTAAAAATLGQSLPELLSLTELALTGVDESNVPAIEMEALFGGFSKELPLSLLTFSVFSVMGSLTPLTKSLPFFPNLIEVKLEKLSIDEHEQCSLFESFTFIPNLRALSVQGGGQAHTHCCNIEVNTVRNFTMGAYKKLELCGISMSPAVAAALGRSLPEMSLQDLKLTGLDGNILQAEEMEVLVGGLNNTFPNLRTLMLEKFNMDERDQCILLKSLRFIPDLTALRVIESKPMGRADCCTAKLNTSDLSTNRTYKSLELDGVSLTPAAVAVIGRLLPEMLSLNALEITGERKGNVLQDEEIEALFGGFHRKLPMYNLILRGFSVIGSIAPLTKSLSFFPDLIELRLDEFTLDERNLCGLLESLKFTPRMRELCVYGKHVAEADCCTAGVKKNGVFILKDLEELELNGVRLTPATAVSLGQSLPEMSSLKELTLRGMKGSILQGEEIEALFGGFKKALPLQRLTFGDFAVTGSLAPLTRSLRFFPNLSYLGLGKFNLDENNLYVLLESLKFIPHLTGLSLQGKQLDQAHCCPAKVNTVGGFILKDLEFLRLDDISLTSATAAALGQLLPEMSSLQRLVLTAGVDGSVLEIKHMEALFGGFNKPLPLQELVFRDFFVRGCLAPLTKSFRFFPKLKDLVLIGLNMDENDLRGLLESFQFIPNLRKLNLSSNPLGQAVTSIVPHIINLPELSELYLHAASSDEDLYYVRKALPHLRFDFSFYLR